MPFYEYECQACGAQVEVLQKITDAPLKKCTGCGKSKLVKLVSAPVFRLKGSGWYETDFKSDKENKRNLVGDDKGEGKADEPKSEAKPEAKPEAKSESAGEAKSAGKPRAKPLAASTGSRAKRSAPARPAVRKPAAKSKGAGAKRTAKKR
jgi:putative FmdB family regulatory protein